jgi:hypothetical protein
MERRNQLIKNQDTIQDLLTLEHSRTIHFLACYIFGDQHPTYLCQKLFRETILLNMEVASPLTFSHVKAGAKRRFACSPLDSPNVVGIESHTDDYAMDDCATFGHSFKKRRCDNVEMTYAPQQPFGSLYSFSPSSTPGKFLVMNDVRIREWFLPKPFPFLHTPDTFC